MVRQRIHTGCSCQQCKYGKNRQTRQKFSRKVRRVHKHQLRKHGDIIDVDVSIGWTD